MKGNRVVIPLIIEPPIAYMTYIRVSAQRSTVQDALCIGQSYRMTSLRLSKRVEITKGTEQAAQNSRTADFRYMADGNSAHGFGGLPGQHTWLQSTTSLVFFPMTSLTARQTKLLQKC